IEVIKSEPVRDRVQKQLGFSAPVSVSSIGDTDVLQIRTRSPNRKRSADLANAYADSYISYRREQAVNDLGAAGQELGPKIISLQKQIDDISAQIAAAPPCGTGTRADDVACSQRRSIEQNLGPRRDALVSQQAVFKQRLDQI